MSGLVFMVFMVFMGFMGLRGLQEKLPIDSSLRSYQLKTVIYPVRQQKRLPSD